MRSFLVLFPLVTLWEMEISLPSWKKPKYILYISVEHGNNLGDMASQGGELERSRSKVVDEEESRSRNVVSEGSHEQRLPAFRRF